MFEDREDLSLAMKTVSDFMRADVSFVMTNVVSGQHFMPQHIFEDSKKMQIPEVEAGFYRIIVFMQSVEYHGGSKVRFEPVIYSFNFRLFSFEQRSETKIYEISVHGEDYDQINVIQAVDHMMAFSSPEKMECYSRGRRLPADLT